MDLLFNNLKAFLIHICSIPIFLIGLFLYVAASPLYQFELIAFIIMVVLYGLVYVVYIGLLMRFLKVSKNRSHDYFSGMCVTIFGLIIWGITYTKYSFAIELKEYKEVWIPYNVYNFLLWPIAFYFKDLRVIMLIGTLNGIFAPIAIYLKRLISIGKSINTTLGGSR